jgi:hypothetical protein
MQLATDELKAFYYEAKAVQPGRHSVAEIQNWFWLFRMSLHFNTQQEF